MRSKEVEEAINQLIVDINFSEAGCSTGIIEVKNIDIVLSYIEELENKLDIKRQNDLKILEEKKQILKQELELVKIERRTKI